MEKQVLVESSVNIFWDLFWSIISMLFEFIRDFLVQTLNMPLTCILSIYLEIFPVFPYLSIIVHHLANSLAEPRSLSSLPVGNFSRNCAGENYHITKLRFWYHLIPETEILLIQRLISGRIWDLNLDLWTSFFSSTGLNIDQLWDG